MTCSDCCARRARRSRARMTGASPSLETNARRRRGSARRLRPTSAHDAVLEEREVQVRQCDRPRRQPERTRALRTVRIALVQRPAQARELAGSSWARQRGAENAVDEHDARAGVSFSIRRRWRVASTGTGSGGGAKMRVSSRRRFVYFQLCRCVGNPARGTARALQRAQRASSPPRPARFEGADAERLAAGESCCGSALMRPPPPAFTQS